MAIRKVLFLSLFIVSCGVENLPPPATPSVKNPPIDLAWDNVDTDDDGISEDYVSSIKSQPCGDCWMYAATGIVETQYKIEHKYGFDVNVSEQNLHNCLNVDCKTGATPFRALQHIRDFGIQEEFDTPTGSWGSCNNCDNNVREYMSFEKMTTLYPITFPYFDRKAKLVEALQNGPVSISIDAWLGYSGNNGTYSCVDPDAGSGHAVSIVGYRNLGEIFIIKNSHGGTKFLEFVFENGDLCGFAKEAIQVSGTYLQWEKGRNYCVANLDFDKDGVIDALDNCRTTPNPNQENIDGDMFGDVCDPCPSGGRGGYYCP